MCTVLLPLGFNQIAVKNISYIIKIIDYYHPSKILDYNWHAWIGFNFFFMSERFEYAAVEFPNFCHLRSRVSDCGTKIPIGICRVTALRLNAASPSGYGAPERQTKINRSTLRIIKEGPLSDITAFTFGVFLCYTPVTMCTVY
jgi:hypothetical protein